MKKLTILTWTTLVILGCTNEVELKKCGCDGTRTEFVANIFGLVVETDEGFKILTDEKGILTPCIELPNDLRADFQPVTVSGQLRFHCSKVNGDFKITPIEINRVESRSTNYDKTDITLTIIKSEDYGYPTGFGYFIEDKRTAHGTRLLQPNIPSIGGFTTFDTEIKAFKTGLLALFSIREQDAVITVEVLEYINVIE